MAGNKSHTWGWVPTLYLAEGLPYALALAVSVVFYKNLGISNGDISFYTGLLYLPWVLKPLWSPAVDILKNAAAVDLDATTVWRRALAAPQHWRFPCRIFSDYTGVILAGERLCLGHA